MPADGLPDDDFGIAVAMSADILEVGAPDESLNGEDAGAAYVFRADESGWIEEQRLVPSELSGITWFGQLWPQEDSEIQQWDETKPLGEIAQVAEVLPRPGWERVETDFGPITLIIPDTSDV